MESLDGVSASSSYQAPAGSSHSDFLSIFITLISDNILMCIIEH